ncbi:hypothetical protein LXL04_037527 [Taraxacum kok-saghyz]
MATKISFAEKIVESSEIFLHEQRSTNKYRLPFCRVIRQSGDSPPSFFSFVGPKKMMRWRFVISGLRQRLLIGEGCCEVGVRFEAPVVKK